MPGDFYSQNYLVLAIMVAFAIGFAVAPLIIARFVTPKKPSDLKNATYECGLEAKGDAWSQLKIQYYLYALSFLIFSLEIIFIVPAAIAFGSLKIFVFANLCVFLLILVAGFLYEWKKGVLEWN